MVGKPTINPKGSKIYGGKSLIPGSVLSPNLGASAAGLTAQPRNTLARQVTVIHSGQITTGRHNRILMKAGANCPRITYVGFSAGTAMYHAAGEADTWRFNLRNMTRGVSLNGKSASLSGITLAITAFKSIALNFGNSTLGDGDCLRLELNVSGTAQTLVQPSMVIHWVPTVNA